MAMDKIMQHKEEKGKKEKKEREDVAGVGCVRKKGEEREETRKGGAWELVLGFFFIHISLKVFLSHYIEND